MNSIFLTTLLACSLLFNSCVSLEKYKDLNEEYSSVNKANETLKKGRRDLALRNTELNENLSSLRSRLKDLQTDTVSLGKDYRRKIRAYNDLSSSYELLAKNNSSAMEKQAKENRNLTEQLGQMELDLQEREKSIQSREQDVYKLKELLKEKDANLSRLKSSVSKALLGFSGEGLTLNQRDGKLYVSLENSLLFASGSWKVNEKGEKAIGELAKVLVKYSDLQIMIEGHTDDIPYNGSGVIKDNWDLSVMRATSIVRILNDNPGLKAKQITAAGKGSYSPLVSNSTVENRAINRRTEIILSPNIDALMHLLE